MFWGCGLRGALQGRLVGGHSLRPFWKRGGDGVCAALCAGELMGSCLEVNGD